MNTLLHGHDSPETAHVHNHPFGRQRCWQRIWVESRAKKGQRVCLQTTKKFIAVEPGQEFDGRMPEPCAWNKPKKATYSAMLVLFVDNENGHIHNTGISVYSGPERFAEFDRFVADADGELSKEQAARRAMLEQGSRNGSPVCWAEHDDRQAA